MRDVQYTILEKLLSSSVLAAPDNLQVWLPVVFPSIIQHYYIVENKAIQVSSSGGSSPSNLKDLLSWTGWQSGFYSLRKFLLVNKSWKVSVWNHKDHTHQVLTAEQCTEAERIQQSPLHWTNFSGKEAEFQNKDHVASFSWTAWGEAIIPRANIPSFGHIFSTDTLWTRVLLKVQFAQDIAVHGHTGSSQPYNTHQSQMLFSFLHSIWGLDRDLWTLPWPTVAYLNTKKGNHDSY